MLLIKYMYYAMKILAVFVALFETMFKADKIRKLIFLCYMRCATRIAQTVWKQHNIRPKTSKNLKDRSRILAYYNILSVVLKVNVKLTCTNDAINLQLDHSLPTLTVNSLHVLAQYP